MLETTQDRLLEKAFLASIGVPVTAHLPVDGPEAIAPGLATLGGEAILKTRRLGYDGKGQTRIGRAGPSGDRGMGCHRPGTGHPRGRRRLHAEVSVVTARGVDGAVASFPVVENRHEHHILRRTIAPAEVTAAIAAEAVTLAERVAREIGLVGLLAVEMFLTRDGRLLVNELAPRPHNSGHWTIDACPTSQFEQLVRAVCGLPLGDPTPICPAMMDNLLGDEALAYLSILAEPGARLHLYGKSEARPGRKMGHVTRLRGAHQSRLSGVRSGDDVGVARPLEEDDPVLEVKLLLLQPLELEGARGAIGDELLDPRVESAMSRAQRIELRVDLPTSRGRVHAGRAFGVTAMMGR